MEIYARDLAATLRDPSRVAQTTNLRRSISALRAKREARERIATTPSRRLEGNPTPLREAIAESDSILPLRLGNSAERTRRFNQPTTAHLGHFVSNPSDRTYGDQQRAGTVVRVIDGSRATLRKRYIDSRNEGTLSAGSRYESCRLCVHRVCHRRTKGATRPRPCVYRRGGRRGARKGMFYNEPKQRRALTSAAGTNGVGWSARAGASGSPFPETAARERSCGINRGLGEGANSPPPLPGGAGARARDVVGGSTTDRGASARWMAQ